jgi:pilus assembly protein TadC
VDPETAWDQARGEMPAMGEKRSSARARQLASLLRHATLTGAPVRDDLQAFLQEHFQELEARWEERVQRLPVALLLPLFLCFFPAALLVLAGLFLPLLGALA